MGGTNYDSTFTTSRVASHKAAGTDIFAHTAAINSGSIRAAVNELLDPSKPNAAGDLVRESFDSDVHPNSRAIGVIFDITASMGTAPRKFVEKLPNFMGMLTSKGYIEDPHVLFGGVGDATCDDGPRQIGQFEGGNEMDDALTNIWIEGGGGGQKTESYELAMYYMARHTNIDCLNKRGQKGYLFIVGDETPYPVIRKSEVKRFIGGDLEADIRLSANYEGWPSNNLEEYYIDSNGRQQSRPIQGDLLAELREKYEVFFIMPAERPYSKDPSVTGKLGQLFGQNFVMLDKAENICELLCMLIGTTEGYDVNDVAADLKAMGASASSVNAASTAVAHYSATRTAMAVADGSLPTSGVDAISRL
jgi:hypothetical protein